MSYISQFKAAPGVPIGALAHFPASAPSFVQQQGREYVLTGAVVDYAAKYAGSVAQASWIGHDGLPVSGVTGAFNVQRAEKLGSYWYVSKGAAVRRSTDLLSWSDVTLGSGGTSYPASLCSNGTYICAGAATGTTVQYSNGGAWANIPTTTLAAQPKVILYGPNGWAAFSSFNGVSSEYATQTNANPAFSAWTLRNPGPGLLPELNGGVVGSGKYVLYGRNGSSFPAIYTSTDAINWTLRYTGGSTATLYDMVWTGAAFLVRSGTSDLLTSSDGVSWATLATKPISAAANAYVSLSSDGAGKVIVITTESSVKYIRTSSDHGATWSAALALIDATAPLEVMAFAGSSYVHVRNSDAAYYCDFSTLATARWVGVTTSATPPAGSAYFARVL